MKSYDSHIKNEITQNRVNGFSNWEVYDEINDTGMVTKWEDFLKIIDYYGFKKLIETEEGQTQIFRDDITGIILFTSKTKDIIDPIVNKAMICGEILENRVPGGCSGSINKDGIVSFSRDVRNGFEYKLNDFFRRLVFVPDWQHDNIIIQKNDIQKQQFNNKQDTKLIVKKEDFFTRLKKFIYKLLHIKLHL